MKSIQEASTNYSNNAARRSCRGARLQGGNIIGDLFNTVVSAAAAAELRHIVQSSGRGSVWQAYTELNELWYSDPQAVRAQIEILATNKTR